MAGPEHDWDVGPGVGARGWEGAGTGVGGRGSELEEGGEVERRAGGRGWGWGWGWSIGTHGPALLTINSNTN